MDDDTILLPRRVRWTLTLSAWGIYAFAFFVLRNRIQPAVAALSMLPVVVTGWYFGIVGSVLAFFSALILNAVLLVNLCGYSVRTAFLSPGVLSGDVILFFVALVVGQISTQSQRYKQEIRRRKSLEKEREISANFLALLNEIISAALATDTLKAMLRILTKRINELIGTDVNYICLWDAERQLTIPVEAYGPTRDEFLNLHFAPGDRTLTSSVMETRTAIPIEDTAVTEYCEVEKAKELYQRSLLCLPLISGERELGSIILGFSAFHHFTQDEITRGEIAASLIALILEKFFAVEDASKRADEAEILRKAGAAVVATLRSDEAIDRILEQLSLVIPYDSASVQLLQDDELEIVGGRGWENPEEVLGLRFSIYDDNPNAIVIETGEPYILTDAISAHSSFRDEGPHNHIRSWLGVPLIVRREIIGLLAIDSTEINYFTKEHLKTVNTFSDQVATALENARLFEETQRQLRTQILVREVSSIVSSALTLEKVLALLAEQICKAVDATSAYINEFNKSENSQVVIAEYFSANACAEERVSDLGMGYSWEELEDEFIEIMEAGQHDYSHYDDPDVPQKEREHMQDFGAKSILYIPLKIKENLIGFAEIWESRYIREFSIEEINICHLIMQQAAIAIENARLFEEVQNLALTDSLTGLYNRRGLFEIGHIEFSRNQRLERPFSAIMLDIDHFKRVNDQYGHPVGDQVLQFLASELRSSVRGVDIIGRFGGEEFLIFLSGSDGNVAMELAERLRITIETTLIQVEKNQIEFTISLGVAEYDENNLNLETLVARADQALYVAKHKGRNQVVFGK